MTPSTLRQAGEALYGARWQRPISRDLGVHYDTVRAWARARNRIPEGVAGELRLLLEDRAGSIEAAAAVLE